MPASTRIPDPKLLDAVRQVLRVHHDSMHPERSSVAWSIRSVRLRCLRSRDHRCPAEPQIEACLTDLAVHGRVAPATQNLAMNALVFIFKRVLTQALQAVSRPCAPTGRSPSPWS
jgi:Phage integrase, N-terminal SAM-like domain